MDVVSNSYGDKVSETGYLCSVCIANYNGESFLRKCVDSVLQQEGLPGPVEIIIHDDASTDNSVSLIQSCYSQVELIKSDENVGFCVSNNRMIAIAKGTFILLLNNDAVLHKDALKTLYNASKNFGDGIYGLSQFNMESGELIDRGSVFDLFLNPIPNLAPSLEDVGMVIGACLFLPRKLWDEIGGFPDFFGSLAEDMYLCCVARLLGYPVKAVKGPGFDHLVGCSLGGGKVTTKNTLLTTKNRRQLSERNKTFVMFICYPHLGFIFVSPVHLFLLLIEGFTLSLIKKDSSLFFDIYWNCIKEVYLYRKKLFSQRKALQRLKRSSLSSFFKPFKFIPHKIKMLIRHGLPEVS